MNVKPLLGRILIKKIKPESQVGNIILTESSQEKSAKGLVIAVGAFEKDKIYDLKIGDVVFFPKWNGTQISKDNADEEFVIIKMDEILGVEEK